MKAAQGEQVIPWFRAGGDIHLGWVRGLADRRQRAKEIFERFALNHARSTPPALFDSVFSQSTTWGTNHKVYSR